MPTKSQWEALVLPTASRREILEAVADHKWQQYRVLLLGRSLHAKWNALGWWLRSGPGEEKQRQVQVSNYVNALKRGGLIK